MADSVRAATAALLIICSITACSDDPHDDWSRLGGADAPIYALQEFRGRLVFGGEFTRVDAFGDDIEVHHLAAFADAENRALDPEVWDVLPHVTDAAGTWYNIEPEPNGNVNAMTIFRGELIVAGAFTYVGPVRANGVARWNGFEWHALGDSVSGGGVQGTVYALANDGDQVLYVGGNLSAAGGSAVRNVAQWNGAAWAPMDAGTNGTVYALHARARQLFAGGAFSEAGGAPANHIASWTGLRWLPLDVGVDGTVRALTTWRGSLIAGGDFTTVNGFEMNHVARWIGVGWLTMNGGLEAADAVTALAVNGEELWAGESRTVGSRLLDAWDGTSWEGRLDGDGSALTGMSVGSYGVAASMETEGGAELWRR
ncbi:MAG TPA: hypothetical protein VF720_10795 [Candidatus Eisenbacteria bacterium]